jgi:DNA-binding transcriptional LysR family regulator
MVYELRQLQHFVEVARHGNYARAAEALGLAQPTLTRSIQALERQVGGKLLDRGRAGAAPTALGVELFARAEHLLRQAEETERDIQLLAGLRAGHVRIGTGAYAADISVGAAAARLCRRHPGISLDISIHDWTALVPRLLDGQVDLVVAEASLAREDERLEVEELPSHRGVLFCRAGHPLLQRGTSLSPDDLRVFAFASTSLPKRLEHALYSDSPRTGFAVRHRADTFELIRRIVLESDAVSGAVPAQIAADLSAGRVAILPLELPGLHSAYGIIRLARRTPSHAALAFIEELRQVEAEIVAGERPPGVAGD